MAVTRAEARRVTAVAVVVIVGVLGVVGIVVGRPEKDNLSAIAAMLAFVTGALAYLKAQQTHLSVNSRLDAMMKHASAASRAQGRVEGEEAERERGRS